MNADFNSFDVSKILCSKCFLDLELLPKKEVIARLCAVASSMPTVIAPERFLKAILARERVMSTGIGNGIAIPHARTTAVSDFVIAVGRSREGIEFEALDSLPVQLVILTAAPDKKRGEFLKFIAKIGAMFVQPEIKRRFLEADTAEEIMPLFLEYF